MAVVMKKKPVFVDFLWTDAASLLLFLVMFMPTKGIVFCSATSTEFQIVMTTV